MFYIQSSLVCGRSKCTHVFTHEKLFFCVSLKCQLKFPSVSESSLEFFSFRAFVHGQKKRFFLALFRGNPHPIPPHMTFRKEPTGASSFPYPSSCPEKNLPHSFSSDPVSNIHSSFLMSFGYIFGKLEEEEDKVFFHGPP